MPVKMTSGELEFWNEMYAKFDPRELSEVNRGIRLTYVDSRALMNRLDTVVGPAGWTIEYRETEKGYIARMGIYIPQSDGSSRWVYKEDGGGKEGMVKKGSVPDEDNDEKSAYTNAFRRVAQNAWGIGRYLYKMGSPKWLNFAVEIPEDGGGDKVGLGAIEAALKEKAGVEPTQPARQQAPAQSQAQAPATRQGNDNFQIPQAGKSVFPRIKGWEDHFRWKGFLDGVIREAQAKGWSDRTGDWNQEQVDVLVGDLIGYIRANLDHYKGEFDHIVLPGEPVGNAPPLPPRQPKPPAGKDLGPLRKEIGSTVRALLTKHRGSPPSTPDLIEEIGTMSENALNRSGFAGERIDSLSGCEDEVWLQNILKIAKEQLQKSVQPQGAAAGGDEDIPF